MTRRAAICRFYEDLGDPDRARRPSPRVRWPACGRSRDLPPARRTIWNGLLAPFPIVSGDGTRHDLRAAYIWSSEEAASVAAGRQRVLDKAEAALTRVRNGLGGRYYKTRRQVDARFAQILARQAAGLIRVTTGARAGKPVISWARDTAADTLDGVYALATNLPDQAGEPQTVASCRVLSGYALIRAVIFAQFPATACVFGQTPPSLVGGRTAPRSLVRSEATRPPLGSPAPTATTAAERLDSHPGSPCYSKVPDWRAALGAMRQTTAAHMLRSARTTARPRSHGLALPLPVPLGECQWRSRLPSERLRAGPGSDPGQTSSCGS